MTREVVVPRLTAAPLRPSPAAPLFTLRGGTMGTTWSAQVFVPAEVAQDAVRASLESAFRDVIAAMSGWDSRSELCRFNRAPRGSWRILSPGFFHVLARALEIATMTDGAFSPTLGAAVDRRGFGPSNDTREWSSSAPDRQREERATWRSLTINPERSAARQPGGATLDLSAIAKGYAVDLAVARLKALGAQSLLVEVGGEYRGEGVKPDGTPWWVMIERPPVDGVSSPRTECVAALAGMALATSGDYRRWRDVNGRRLTHIIGHGEDDAAPGERLASVSVLHPSCMEADAWATALYALGEADGLAHADRHDLPALFLGRAPDGVRSQASAALKAMIEDEA